MRPMSAVTYAFGLAWRCAISRVSRLPGEKMLRTEFAEIPLFLGLHLL